MGFWNFFKSNKNNNAENKFKKTQENIDRMEADLFPKGLKDKNALADFVLVVLNNKIVRKNAMSIGIRGYVLSNYSKNFTVEELKDSLESYCQHFFNDKDLFNEEQLKQFYEYLIFLNLVRKQYRKTPSEVVRESNNWVIKE